MIKEVKSFEDVMNLKLKAFSKQGYCCEECKKEMIIAATNQLGALKLADKTLLVNCYSQLGTKALDKCQESMYLNIENLRGIELVDEVIDLIILEGKLIKKILDEKDLMTLNRGMEKFPKLNVVKSVHTDKSHIGQA